MAQGVGARGTEQTHGQQHHSVSEAAVGMAPAELSELVGVVRTPRFGAVMRAVEDAM